MSNLDDRDFGENFLHKVKEEKLSPKPKWQFLFKNSLLWGLGIFSLILGAASTSLVFYMLKSEDAGAYSRAGSGMAETLLFVIPFFWIICLAIFAISVYYYIKHTKKGYKYSARSIILVIIGASLVLGGIFNLLGIDRFIDDTLGERAPFYDRVINPRLKYWSNPDSGRLSGLIISEINPLEYDLVDRQGDDWRTLLSPDEDDALMVVGHPVILVGKEAGDHQFMVREILPVGPGRGFFKRPMLRHAPRNCDTDKASGSCNLPMIIPAPNY